MKISAPPSLVIGIAAACVLVLALFAILPVILFNNLKPSLAMDDANLISVEMYRLYRRVAAPTQDEIDAEIRKMIQMGTIGGSVDAAGKPLDRWGTPYKVTHTVDKLIHWATVVGAGPDRTFGTPDDANCSMTWESAPLLGR